MKKVVISFFILVDLGVMAGSAFFLLQYIQAHQRQGNRSVIDVRSLPVAATSTPESSMPTMRTPATPPASSLSSTGAAPETGASSVPSAPRKEGLAAPTTPEPTKTMAPVSTASNNHNVLFSYFNSKAKEVFIRADFTGWRAEPMQKVGLSKWIYTAVLTPGEYAYCFSVDGRSIKDPANKRSKRVGQTIVSAKTVGPPQAASSVTGTSSSPDQ